MCLTYMQNNYFFAGYHIIIIIEVEQGRNKGTRSVSPARGIRGWKMFVNQVHGILVKSGELRLPLHSQSYNYTVLLNNTTTLITAYQIKLYTAELTVTPQTASPTTTILTTSVTTTTATGICLCYISLDSKPIKIRPGVPIAW